MSDVPLMNRRRALQRGVSAAAAAFAVPAFVPGHVFASAGSPGANERIVVGIVGMGIRGCQLVYNIPESGRIAAICDADSRKTALAAQELGDHWHVQADYRKLFDRKDLDAVLICTPHHQHVLPAILACQAGLHVFVEKPLSRYVTEGRALVKAARKYGCVVQTGSQARSMEMNRFACEFVRDGGIGRVRVVEAISYGYSRPYPADGLPEEPVPAGLDWEIWQGPAPQRPYNARLTGYWSAGEDTWRGWLRSLAGERADWQDGQWHRTWLGWQDYSGASLADMGAHAYDMIQYALGADDSGPVEFWPVGEGGALDSRVDFRYANGVEVRLNRGRHAPGPATGAVFTGEKCRIEINRNKFTTNPPDFIRNPPDPALAEKWEQGTWLARWHIQNWFDCIQSGELPHADVEIGHRTATLCHLIGITRQLQRRLRWDPQAEQFLGDSEANALLERPHRKGWELPEL